MEADTLDTLLPQSRPDETYSDEYFIHKEYLYTIRYQERALKAVQECSLTKSAKSGYKNLILSLFDPTSILARLDNIDLSLTDAEILLNMNQQNFRPSDVKLAAVTNMNQTILMLYRMALTRAVGGFEIENQHKTSMGEFTQKQVLSHPPQDSQQRGFKIKNPFKKG